MTATPTGRHERRGTTDALVWERTFRAPIDDVWAAVTESERLERWIGTWTGDPADGFVTFTMNAEGEDIPPSRYEIRACEPPRLLRIDAVDDFGAWYLTLELREDAGVTTLTMSQVIDDVSTLENTGPGWEYYLDRLVAAETGADPAAVDWDDYYPAMRDHYVAIADRLATPS
ncbi:SRPBCC family protein [Aeromicrobium phragmitis]|uniref:SRPBCC family protein n=1 Tax=Aeromicrobium phragmitis TaxID=2478914 RepID=A0A3L8PR91_9ACTN|nr:SRPBCC family protein [Aeromicrobium phragmitis]RLV57399.1 SRPBCC family protein [Aeromicrobium phragmitis]